MNYRYAVGDDVYVLTPTEHLYCVSQFKKGQNIIGIRPSKELDGAPAIMINMHMLRSARPTAEPTDVQYTNQMKALPNRVENIPEQRGRVRKLFCEDRTKRGVEHPTWCDCRAGEMAAKENHA